jgi:branched-chain amino acid transport system permease protein
VATEVETSVRPRSTPRRVLDQTLVRHLAIALAAGLALYLLSESLSAFDNLQLATMAYYFVAVAGLTVLTGLNGQISLGHGALMAIGAYTAAKLLEGPAWPLALVLVVSTVVTAVAGVLAGAAAARLRGPYLAGATLALAVGLPSIADKFPGFLGAANGISVTPPVPPESLGATFPLERWQAWITCLAAVIVYVLLANLVRSRFGRSFRAVRDSEVAAELAGLHVARTQVLAFVVSAACAGLAGGLFVVVTQLAAPGAFPLALSVALLTGVILGGLGSLMGAVWGAAALVLIPTWSDDLSKSLSLSTNVQANLALAVYGVVLIAVMLAAPGGLQAAVHRAAGAVTGALRTSNRSRGSGPRLEEEKET